MAVRVEAGAVRRPAGPLFLPARALLAVAGLDHADPPARLHPGALDLAQLLNAPEAQLAHHLVLGEQPNGMLRRSSRPSGTDR